MSESTETYRIQGSRVYGNGESYNVTNKITAEQLCNTLNKYENTLRLNQNLDKQYDKIQKQLIQVNMTLNILNDEIKNLTSGINELNNR